MAWIYKVTNKAGQMSQSDMENNAKEVFNQLSSYGWSLNAISAVLGNMTKESYINPAQTQIGYPINTMSGGYGLVQWTPARKFKQWAIDEGHNITDGYWQLYDLDTQAHGTEYLVKPTYPLSYDEFKVSDGTPAYLTEVFLKNYERAGVEALQERISWAEYWYDYLGGETPEPSPEPPTPPPPPTPIIERKGMPVWMMIRHI